MQKIRANQYYKDSPPEKAQAREKKRFGAIMVRTAAVAAMYLWMYAYMLTSIRMCRTTSRIMMRGNMRS
eukprot:COSAG05_NODE_142_length_16591_cov_6.726837_9_plen_69_part_00